MADIKLTVDQHSHHHQPIERPHLQISHELDVVVEQLQLVQQVLHDEEGEEGVAGALLSIVRREISLLCGASGDHCKLALLRTELMLQD